MNLLFTGANGFIAKELITRFKKKSYVNKIFTLTRQNINLLDFKSVEKYFCDNKIDFVLFPNDRPDSEIEQYIYSMDFDKYDAMLIIFEKDRWTAKETFKIARDLEVKAQRKGILLGEDHPEMVETVGSSKINNGKYIIFFLQNLKQVEDAAEKLRQTSYYFTSNNLSSLSSNLFNMRTTLSILVSNSSLVT